MKTSTADYWDNIQKKNMVSPFEIHLSDIPLCPICGNYLIPNLRCDDTFVQTPHIKNVEDYKIFIQNAYDNNIVLKDKVSEKIMDKSLFIQEDIGKVLYDIKNQD